MRILPARQDDNPGNRGKGQQRGGGRSQYPGCKRDGSADQQGRSPSARLARPARRARALRPAIRASGSRTRGVRRPRIAAQCGGLLGGTIRRDPRRRPGAGRRRAFARGRAVTIPAPPRPQPSTPGRRIDRGRCRRHRHRRAVRRLRPPRPRRPEVEHGRDREHRYLPDLEDRIAAHRLGQPRFPASSPNRPAPVPSRSPHRTGHARDATPQQRASTGPDIRSSGHIGRRAAPRPHPAIDHPIPFIRRDRQSHRRVRRPRPRYVPEWLRSTP